MTASRKIASTSILPDYHPASLFFLLAYSTAMRMIALFVPIDKTVEEIGILLSNMWVYLTLLTIDRIGYL